MNVVLLNFLFINIKINCGFNINTKYLYLFYTCFCVSVCVSEYSCLITGINYILYDLFHNIAVFTFNKKHINIYFFQNSV